MDEDSFLNPYNVDNVLITSSDISKMFSKFNIEISIHNLDYYQQALTHKSYIKSEYDCIDNDILTEAKNKFPQAIELFEKSNERLEFLGDTIIKCIFSEYLFKRYPEEDEGFMTRLKTKIEDKDSLARYAYRLGIDYYLIISKQIEENNGRKSNKLLEDAFEAFIGALYLDLGFDVCKKFLTIILETEIDYAEILYRDTNYKDQLLKFYHSNKWSHPIYRESQESKMDNSIHSRLFVMELLDINNKVIAKASDVSKKKAEQKCAMIALYHYKQINKDQLTNMTKNDINI